MSDSPLPLEAGAPSPIPPRVANALPDFALGAFCLGVWLAPERFPPDVVRWIVLTMVLEFIVIHSAAFMGTQLLAPGPTGGRAARVLGLGCFYTLFVAGFSLMFHTAWPLVSFWLLTLNRLGGVLLRQAPSGDERTIVQSGWAASVLCYLGAVMLTTIAPLPRLGFAHADFTSFHLPGSGLWISQPWRVVAAGALYFTAVGFFELDGFRSLRAHTEDATRRLAA